MWRRRILRAALVAMACMTPVVAWAQDSGAAPPAPPPAIAPSTASKRLDFRLALVEAYNRASTSDTMPALAVDPNFRRAAMFSAANAALDFSSTSRGVSFRATGAANLRHFSAAPSLVHSDYFGGLNVSTRLARSVTAHAAQHISYSPYYSLVNVLQSGELTPDDALRPDYGLVRVDTFSAGSSTGLTWAAGARTSVNLGYALHVVDTMSSLQGTLAQGANAGLGRQLTQYSRLRLGYGYRRSNLGARAAPFEMHDLGTGLGYGRPISSSRRTAINFDTGASVVVGDSRRFVATGSASLTHQLARTWGSALSYHRGVSAYAGVSHPYVTDAVTGTVGGLVARRLSLALSTGYTRGRAAVDITNGFTSAFGSARLMLSAGRYLPMFGEYVYYHSRFDRATGLGAGFPVFVSRQGLRVGLSYSMPLIGRRPT